MDCILIALREIMADAPPHLVLSGVNSGQNLAEDTGQSGTIGAAMTAMQFGTPAIAMSQVYDYDTSNIAWTTARTWGRKILPLLIREGWSENVVPNVNFPNLRPEQVTGIQSTRQGARQAASLISEQRIDMRGRPYSWAGFAKATPVLDEGTDLRAINEGRVSITPLHADMTHLAEWRRLDKILSAQAMSCSDGKRGNP